MTRTERGSLLEFVLSVTRGIFQCQAFISRASEIPFVAYFIYKDASKFVIEQEDYFSTDEFSETAS